LNRSGDHLQQRRLARAIATHDAPALATTDGEVDAIVDDASAVAFGDALERGDLVAGPRRRAEVEFHDAALLRQFDLLDLLQCFHAALDLRRLCRVRGEPLDEALLLGEHGLLPGVGGFAIGFADGALAFVEVVVAGIGRDLAAVDLGDARDDAVHELAIVRGHEQRAGE
jgi:hypothetical protein